MTYYKKKRIAKGMSRSDIANALGIDYVRYDLIEKGEVKMPRNLIDKFNEVINKGKINDIEKLNRDELVNQWWEEMKQKDENGNFKLKQKMKEFNIDTFRELASLLGWKDGSNLSNYLNENVPISYDAKNRIYSFFENELNIQVPKKEKEENLNNNDADKELFDWYHNINLKEWMTNHNKKWGEVIEESGVSSGTLSNLANKKFDRPTIGSLLKLKNYIDKIESNYQEVTEEVIEEVIEQPEIKICNNLQDKLYNKYYAKDSILEEKEKDILNKIENLKKELASINTYKKIYEEILEEVKEDK